MCLFDIYVLYNRIKEYYRTDKEYVRNYNLYSTEKISAKQFEPVTLKPKLLLPSINIGFVSGSEELHPAKDERDKPRINIGNN